MKVDYEQLVKEYNENMQTKLRGCRPNQEFLEMWVHDENDTLSLINIIESAHMCGLKNLEISVSKETFTAIDQNQIKESLQSVGSISIQDDGTKKIIAVSYE